MTFIKKMTRRRIKRVGSQVFYCKQSNRLVFRHLTLKKSLGRLITEHIPDVITIISQRQPSYYECCRWQHFLKIFKAITSEKNVIRYYFCSINTVEKLQLILKSGFHTDEKVFQLLCTENDLNILQNVAIYLFKCFVSHITVIP